MNLPPGAVLAYSFEPEAPYWRSVTVSDPTVVPDILIQAAVPGEGCYWEFLVEDDGSGQPSLSRDSDPDDVDQARGQVPELFAALAEMRPRTLEEVRAILVSLGAEDVTKR